MSTTAGIITTAIGEAIQAALGAGWGLKYSATDWSGVGRDTSTPTVFVRYMQESEQVAGSMMSTVRPLISIYVAQPHAVDPTTADSHEATLDLMADVRAAVHDLCIGHSQGTAPIAGLDGPLFYDAATSTPAVASLGGGLGGVESVTIDFQLRYIRPAGGR